MEDKFILVSIHDEGSKKIAEAIGNKTCKRIIDFLSETKNSSEKDIADALEMPINTIEYNLKKLIESGLVKKAKSYFWSSKGKRIPTYEVSNKMIVISPKRSKPVASKLKSLIPVVLIVGLLALVISSYSNSPGVEFKGARVGEDYASVTVAGGQLEVAGSFDSDETYGNDFISMSFDEPEMWFLSGAVIALLIFTIFNWRKL